MCETDKNCRQEFADLLREIRISPIYDEQEKLAVYSRLNGYIKENMPKSLFRYRTLADYSIEAFCKGFITVAKPSEMGDIFDSQISVDIKKVVSEIENMEHGIDGAADYLFKGNNIPNDFLRPFSRKIRRTYKSNRHRFKGNIRLKPETKLLANYFKDILSKRAEEKFGQTIDVLKQTGYIACFCEDVCRLKMWSDYADKHKGYALEYDFEALNAKFPTIEIADKRLQPDYIVLPVIYGEKYDSTEIIIYELLDEQLREIGGREAYIKNPDELWAIKGYLYKALDYESEAEWRLITPINGVTKNSKPYEKVYAKPKAVYYGTEMTEEMFQKLDAIAKENGIKRYRMRANPSDVSVEAMPL